jgi:hypothetical protein
VARNGISVARIEEIQRLIQEGQTDRFISRALKCRRAKVAEVRRTGALAAPSTLVIAKEAAPLWTERVDWPGVLKDIGGGFQLKRIWEEKASEVTSHSNFWKQLYRRYPYLLKATVTLREFDPGTHCEVDYAGDRIEWIDRNGEVHEAHIFIGVLCFSQLIFAWASCDETSQQWLSAHQKMYTFFGGVPHVTVCDCLKTGVSKVHRYDPDLNPSYAELAVHYATAIVPARPYHPKDKALAENAVGLVIRLFRFVYRRHRFFSLGEINLALTKTYERINLKPHTRFKISRRQRWQEQEKEKLKALPITPYEPVEWKTAKVHPDSTIAVDSATYSVPHAHRGKSVRVKLTPNHIEVFSGLERIKMHSRDRSKRGVRVIDNADLPLNSIAYREGTPSSILSQARFIQGELYDLIDDLFQKDTLGNLRRAQGLIRRAHLELQDLGRERASKNITKAINKMREYQRIRVSYFAECLIDLRKQTFEQAVDREIQRLPNNPMLRNQPAAIEAIEISPPPKEPHDE